MGYNGPLERLEPSVRMARSALDYYSTPAAAHCENGATKAQVSQAKSKATQNLIALLANIEKEIEALRRKEPTDVSK